MLMRHGEFDFADTDAFVYSQRARAEGVPTHIPIGYADSKLAGALFSRELAEKYKGK